MDLIIGIKTRRSIRKYQNTAPISHDIFEEIVELASFAPSWKNTQTARYVLLEDRALINRLADEAVIGFEPNANIMRNTPNIVILASVNKRSGYERDGSFSTSKEDRWEVFDAGIAAQTFCLAAHEKGYGTVIMGLFDDEKTARIIDLPQGQTVAAIIALGLPDEVCEAPRRKPVSDLVSYR